MKKISMLLALVIIFGMLSVCFADEVAASEAQPVGFDDLTVELPDEKREINILEELYNNSLGDKDIYYYLYYMPGVDVSREGTILTHRGVRFGDTAATVTEKYGGAELTAIDWQSEWLYNRLKYKESQLAGLMKAQCAYYISYDAENIGSVYFYFDADEQLSWLVYCFDSVVNSWLHRGAAQYKDISSFDYFVSFPPLDSSVNYISFLRSVTRSGSSYAYCYYGPDDDCAKEEVLVTARDVRLGDSYELVAEKYGENQLSAVNWDEDLTYRQLCLDDEECAGIMRGQCVSSMSYEADGIGVITFYFDSNDELCWTLYIIDSVQDAYSKHKQEVKAVQEMLNYKGYDCGTPDGDAGPKTEKAIAAFQSDNGLETTGYINYKTLELLFS